jgi:ubiquinone/menaquinone biosynthesis C-methylase UbiE
MFPTMARRSRERAVTANWGLDELAHAGAEHLDADFVTAYDRKQKFDPRDDVAVLLANGLGPDSTLIDFAAGTGTLTLAVAPHVGRVVAVDVSPAMIAQLSRRLEPAGVDNVEFVQAGFLSYQHRGPPADAVYTRNALHQLPDFWKGIALDRIARTLKPGGLLVVRDLIYDFQPHETNAKLGAWLDSAVDDPAEGYTREDFAVHIRSEHSTYRWLFEPLLATAGFTILNVEYRRAVYGAYLCRKT